MNIFNSLGSNYDLSYLIRSLAMGTKKDSDNLKRLLEKRYGGESTLLYKGREALTLALQILNLDSDTQVAINGFTCVAVFNAIRAAGYEPKCLDLEDSGGLNFTPNILAEEVKKNKKIKVVVIQNTFGYMCEISEIQKICRQNDLILIEDLAHCIGAVYDNGEEVGTSGDFVVLSFSQDKIIDAVSGGALIVRNKKYIGKANNFQRKDSEWKTKDKLYPFISFSIRVFYFLGIGKYFHYIIKRLGLLSNIMNTSFYRYYNLPDWNAMQATYEFNNLPKNLSHRRKIAHLYASLLPESLFMFDRKKTQEAINRSSNLRFPIFTDNRKKFIASLKKSGVYISDTWYVDVAPDCPNAVGDSKVIVNLPTHKNVNESDAKKICEIINSL